MRRVVLWRGTLQHETATWKLRSARFFKRFGNSRLTEIRYRKLFIAEASLSKKSFINSMKFSFPWNRVKFANVCRVFATRVRFLAPFSFGYSGKQEKNRLRSRCPRFVYCYAWRLWIYTFWGKHRVSIPFQKGVENAQSTRLKTLKMDSTPKSAHSAKNTTAFSRYNIF